MNIETTMKRCTRIAEKKEESGSDCRIVLQKGVNAVSRRVLLLLLLAALILSDAAFAAFRSVPAGRQANRAAACSSDAALPASLTEIAEEAFAGTGLTDIRLPVGLHVIGSRAFADVRGLKAIAVPASVQKIGADAFGTDHQVAILAPTGSYAHAWAGRNGYVAIATDRIIQNVSASLNVPLHGPAFAGTSSEDEIPAYPACRTAGDLNTDIAAGSFSMIVRYQYFP